MPQLRGSTEITCPACGHRFALEGRITEHLEQQWRAKERAVLRRQMSAEIDEKAQAKAQKLSETQLRTAREELRERERRIASLQGQLTKLQNKLPAPRAQALGIQRGHTLVDILKERFPFDVITATPRGVAGADVNQEIHEQSGRICGSIIWESKRAASWSNAWTKKLVTDQKRGGHTVGVIVSEVLPDEDRVLMQVDSLWACTLQAAPELAAALRQGIIAAAAARAANASRDDLKGRVYDYLTSPGFATRITSVVKTAIDIRIGIDAERRAMNARWAERELQAHTIIEDIAVVYGELRGIGTSLRSIDALELEPKHKALPAPGSSTASNIGRRR